MSLRQRILLSLSLLILPAAMAAPDPGGSPRVPRRIACIGDSITEGSGLSNPALESYPGRLQRLFGPADTVRNFGVSGRTLLKRGDYPYWKEAAYSNSRAYNPDVVLIKLGTNDSKPQNWRYGTNFVADLEELIASFRSLPASPRVILCTPAPVYGAGAFGISPGIVATNIAPIVRETAARLGLEVCDFHTLLAGHAEWFPDTVHPTTSGAAVMASHLFRLLHLGEPLPEAAPELLGTRSVNQRAVLAWPARNAGWVLQVANRPDAARAAWTVSTAVPISDGTTLRLTNTLSAPRFFRLWQP